RHILAGKGDDLILIGDLVYRAVRSNEDCRSTTLDALLCALGVAFHRRLACAVRIFDETFVLRSHGAYGKPQGQHSDRDKFLHSCFLSSKPLLGRMGVIIPRFGRPQGHDFLVARGDTRDPPVSSPRKLRPPRRYALWARPSRRQRRRLGHPRGASTGGERTTVRKALTVATSSPIFQMPPLPGWERVLRSAPLMWYTMRMKRTNLVLDAQILEEATRVLGVKTYSATVNQALAEVIRIRKIQSLPSFFGNRLWEGELAE